MKILTLCGTITLVIVAVTLLSCRSADLVSHLDYDESSSEAVISQTTIWEHQPDQSRSGARYADQEGTEYYISRSSISTYDATGSLRWEYNSSASKFDGWDIRDDLIRTAEHVRNKTGNSHQLYIAAIGQSGQLLWKTLVFDTADWVRISDFNVSESGWTYFYYDTSRVSEEWADEIIAIDPQGQIGWTARPTHQHPDKDYIAKGYDSIKPGKNGTLWALDYCSVAYLYDQDGKLLSSNPCTLDTWLTRGVFSQDNGENIFVTENSGGIGYWDYTYWFGEPPEYFVTGVMEEDGQAFGNSILMFNYDVEELWHVPSRSIITATALDSQGGLIIGGYAGEVAAFDNQGVERWRYLPDQQMEAQYSWKANGYEHPVVIVDAFVGVGSLVVSPVGDIAVSTQTGLLYVVDSGGNLRWMRYGATGSPHRVNGYGIGPFDYNSSSACSGLSWDVSGNLECRSGNGLVTYDAVDGTILNAVPHKYASYMTEANDGSLRLTGGLYAAALDASGALLWEAALPDNACARPCVDAAANTYIPTARGAMCMLGPGGVLEWESVLPERVLCYPSVGADGNVFAMTIDGRLLSISPSGAVVWSLDGMNQDNLPPAPCPAGIAAITGDGSLALAGYEGGILWERPLDNPVLAPPATNADSDVFAGDSYGVVYAFDSAGTELFKHIDTYIDGDHTWDYLAEIQLPPFVLDDGGVVVEFASLPYYGDVFPILMYPAVKCLSASGELRWQLPQDSDRKTYEGHSNLLVPGLVNGQWALSSNEEGRIAVSPQGEVLPLEFPEDYIRGHLATIMSNDNGYYVLDHYGGYKLVKSEIAFY